MRLKAFIDSHLHALGLGYYQDIINLNSVTSIENIINLLKQSEKDVIVARGFNQDNLIEKRMPLKQDLDEISKPVAIFRICGHIAVINQAMIDSIGTHKLSYQVFGGSFNLETGLFTEKALSLISEVIPKPTKDDLKRYLIKANDILLENGITKVASDDFSSFDIDYEIIIEAINEVIDEGKIDISITEQVNLPLNKFKDFIKKGYVNKKYRNFKMGPLKILADGSLGGRTASLNEAYSDDPSNFGILTFSDNELSELIDLAFNNDMDVVVHAIGDKACDQAIKIISSLNDKYDRKSPNNAIIHAQVLNKRQIDLLRINHINAIVQPIFINTDIKIISDRIGNRDKESYLFKTMSENINLGFSTDSPVETVNPFHNIYCAVTRKSLNFPEYPPFNSEEAFSLNCALKAYTDNNLGFVYEKESFDYIEIDKDIYNLDLEELKDVKVLKTFIDKKIVYERKK